MKFGKLLQTAADGFPTCDGLFLRYKELKKQLKSMKKSAGTLAGRGACPRSYSTGTAVDPALTYVLAGITCTEDDLEDHADEAIAPEESDTTSVHHEASTVQEATSLEQPEEAQQTVSSRNLVMIKLRWQMRVQRHTAAA